MSWWLNYLMHFSIAFIVFEPLYGCWVVKCIVLILFHVDFFNSNHNILILHRIENYCSINVLNASTKWYVTQYDVCQFIVGSSKNWVFFFGGGGPGEGEVPKILLERWDNPEKGGGGGGGCHLFLLLYSSITFIVCVWENKVSFIVFPFYSLLS